MKKENASVAAETENNATKNVHNPEYLVDIQHERLSFFTPAGEVKALNDVSLYVQPGEVLGIVGESFAFDLGTSNGSAVIWRKRR